MPGGLTAATFESVARSGRASLLIEVPKWSFVKRGAERIDFVSPLPCPFNYGSVPGTRGADGEPIDGILLGGRLARGSLVTCRVVGVARFVDAGCEDHKLVLSSSGISRLDQVRIALFFHVYALAKRVAQGLRGGRGTTRYSGFVAR